MNGGGVRHIDLHVHSTFSDGRASVAQILAAARACDGLEALALTDHDSAGGVAFARRLNAQGGRRLVLVDGIEISAAWGGGVMHLLGYFPPGALDGAPEVMALCRENVEGTRRESVLNWAPRVVLARLAARWEALVGAPRTFDVEAIVAEVGEGYRRACAKAAEELGHELEWPLPPGGRLWREVMASRGVAPLDVLDALAARDPAREDVLAAYWRRMLARHGGRRPAPGDEALIHEAAREDRGFVLQAERSSITLADAVGAVCRSGGVPVMAHCVPSLRARGAAEMESALEALPALGIRGLEAYYPLHSGEDTERIIRFCAARGLVVTGGTDYHGAPGAKVGELPGGRCVPPLPIVDELGAP